MNGRITVRAPLPEVVKVVAKGPQGPQGDPGEGSAEAVNAERLRAEIAEQARVLKAGDTMSGPLTLPGNPGSNLQAAPKQYVDAAIAALVNGAPTTFDTLKEISDRLKLDEEGEVALAALVAQKLVKSANLSDLVDAAAARTNLGLGTAATRSHTDYDPAGAAAAEVVAREAAIQLRVEEVAREGAPEKFWPALAGFKLFKTQALVPAASSGHLLRWVPPRNMTLRGISVVTTVAATANDECAVALKDSDGKTTLAKSLATAGKLNGTPARQDIDFTGDIAVTGGHVYYLGFQYGTVAATAATMLSAEVVNGNSVGGIWSPAAGSAFVGQATPIFPFATETAFSTSSNRVYQFARER